MKRVVQWSTGGVGKLAAQALFERDDFDLVGVLVHSDAKAGRDAGEVCGDKPWHITTTQSVDDIISLKPDCVVFCEIGDLRPNEVIDRFCQLLEHGINVVSTSIAGLVHHNGFDPGKIQRLNRAGHDGGASLYVSGMEPGFAADQLVLVLTTLSRNIRSIRTQEIFLYDKYPVVETMRDAFGFGLGPGHTALVELPGVQAHTWSAPVRMVADALGVELDCIRETYEKRTTDKQLNVAMGVIEPGTVGAVRFETIGVVNGRDAIIIEHVNRMAADMAPDWPTADHPGTYRIIIEGDPDITVELKLGDAETYSDSDSGMTGTAMRIVNAIHAVCDARPGLVTSLDLPLTIPRHAMV